MDDQASNMTGPISQIASHGADDFPIEHGLEHNLLAEVRLHMVEGLRERWDGVVIVESRFTLIGKLLQIEDILSINEINQLYRHIRSPHVFCSAFILQ